MPFHLTVGTKLKDNFAKKKKRLFIKFTFWNDQNVILKMIKIITCGAFLNFLILLLKVKNHLKKNKLTKK